ncbi:MAG: hypothetical protein AB8B71_20145 [Paracoccaceae bacterium]
MTQMTFDFKAPQPVIPAPDTEANDYHRLPVSEKQLRFAHQIAARLQTVVPDHILTDRQALSGWIDDHKSLKARTKNTSQFANYPSSKQVAFAERIARMKRRVVPQECFKDRTLMGRWIDGNL